MLELIKNNDRMVITNYLITCKICGRQMHVERLLTEGNLVMK